MGVLFDLCMGVERNAMKRIRDNIPCFTQQKLNVSLLFVVEKDQALW
jgi:hypothetical protein